MENKFTFKEYKFPDGRMVKCTVAFNFLIQLREANEKIYERVNKCLLLGVKELADAPFVLYGAYLCACYAGENGGVENIIPENEFIDALDDDLTNVEIVVKTGNRMADAILKGLKG